MCACVLSLCVTATACALLVPESARLAAQASNFTIITPRITDGVITDVVQADMPLS